MLQPVRRGSMSVTRRQAYGHGVSSREGRTVPAEPPAGSRGRRRGRRTAGVLSLPPWRRAPLLGARQPTVLFAVIGAAAVVACASSSAALFLSSAASESLRVQLAAQCPDAANPVLEQTGFFGEPDVDPQVRAAVADAGLAAPYSIVAVDGTVALSSGPQSRQGHVFYRDDALQNVAVLSRSPEEGLMLPQEVAAYLQVSAGDRVRIGDEDFVVAGTYRELFIESVVRPYWCSYTSLFLNLTIGPGPPPLVLATSADVAERVGDAGGQAGMTHTWVSPIDTTGLTISEARAIAGQRDRAFAASGISRVYGGIGPTGQLPDLIQRTDRVIAGLRGPVIPIAIGGASVALLLMAASGSYWVTRREQEVRLLVSRGVGPAALGGKALLELAGAAAAGTALGWLLARGLVVGLGPSSYVDASAPRQAAVTAAGGLVAGLVALTVVAAARSRAVAERPVGVGHTVTGRLPWELVLLVAAAVSWYQLRQGEPIVVQNNVARVPFLLVSYPLLFLAGGAVLVVRGVLLLLPRLRRATIRQGPAVYLAARRVTGATVVSAVLLVTACLPVGMLIYSATLTDTSQHTLETKARVLVGSDIAVISVDHFGRTDATDAVGTVVDRYPSGTLDEAAVTVLAVDPDTFARWAFWDDSFASRSLPTLLAALTLRPDGPLAAISMGAPEGPANLALGAGQIAVDVVAAADTFPGRRAAEPTLVVNKEQLGAVDVDAERVTELWTTTDVEAAVAALDEETRVFRVQDRDTVFNVSNFQAVEWTFQYLQALAAFIALIALGGLLLYLESRQRSRVAAYAMARRMGLTAGAHLRSMLVELHALLAVAFVLGGALGAVAVWSVYNRLDIDPARPPGPLLDVPNLTITVAAGCAAMIATAAALYAHRAAVRVKMADALRLPT